MIALDWSDAPREVIRVSSMRAGPPRYARVAPFTDPVIIPGVTAIRALHVQDLRSAVIALE